MNAELAALREGLFEQGTWQDTLVDQCYSRSTPSGLHPPPPPPVLYSSLMVLEALHRNIR
jgi:hypothetical protein